MGAKALLIGAHCRGGCHHSRPILLELDEVDQITARIIELDRPDRPGILRHAAKVNALLL